MRERNTLRRNQLLRLPAAIGTDPEQSVSDRAADDVSTIWGPDRADERLRPERETSHRVAFDVVDPDVLTGTVPDCRGDLLAVGRHTRRARVARGSGAQGLTVPGRVEPRQR